MEYNGAQAETGINTPAETAVIDFYRTYGRNGERQRPKISTSSGGGVFADGYLLVGKSGNQFYVTKGTGCGRAAHNALQKTGILP